MLSSKNTGLIGETFGHRGLLMTLSEEHSVLDCNKFTLIHTYSTLTHTQISCLVRKIMLTSQMELNSGTPLLSDLWDLKNNTICNTRD